MTDAGMGAGEPQDGPAGAAPPGWGGCHWPRCRLPDGSCDEARNCVNRAAAAA